MSSAWEQKWDEDPPPRSRRGLAAAIALLIIASAVVTWFAFARLRHEGLDAGAAKAQDGPIPAAVDATTSPSSVASSMTTAEPSSTTAEPSTTVEPSTTAEPSATAETTTAIPATTVLEPSAPDLTADPAPVPVTLPDGSPVPVLAVFDVDRITLSGAVPSESARERLKALALANSKTPVPVVDLLVIDSSVPAGVPVRVIEKTSTRFDSGSAEISPDHALELDRVANVLNLLPNITVVVIGHADQRGDEASNFALSEARAQAVTGYLASKGVAPSRLAARAVGEDDLLSLNDDDAALALNRRTEFVFTGLLVGA